jgi:hypothetical protein
LLTIASGAANEPTGGLGGSRTKTSAKVVLPAKSTNSTDHKDSTGLSSPKGALLGLASYDSDDDDDDDDDADADGKDKMPISNFSDDDDDDDDDADADGKDKMPISNLSSKANAGAVNTEGKAATKYSRRIAFQNY